MSVERYEVASFDGLSIPVWKSGQGQPVLFVHGATSNHEGWEPVRAHLDDRFTVATMDRRAHLEDPFAPLSLDDEFRDVAAVASSLGDSVTVFGHSSGALVAMGAALEIPNLRGLILYEPPPPEMVGADPEPEGIALAERMEARLKADDLEGLMDAFLEGVVGPLVTDWDAWNGARAELTPCARSLPRELAAVGQCTRLRPEVFEGFASPTLHVSGSKSAEGLRGWVEPLSKAIPDFRTAGLPGQEHLANYTGPEVVAEAVAKFLGEVT